MAQVYTVTGSTSVLLISTIQTPNTVVLLSSIQYPGHIVGIRDITGSPLIARYPIVVSTISGLTFYDGSISTLIDTPNGSISLSSRNSNTWQLLNNQGFLTSLSNTFIDTLTTQYAFISLTSTAKEFISSVQTDNLAVTNTIEVQGNTQVEGNLTIGGSFNVFSSVHAYQNLSLSTTLEVGGNVSIPSSLSIKDTLQVGSNLSTLQNLVIGNNLNVDKSVTVFGALLPRFISVQTLATQFLETGGGLQLAGGLSTAHLSVAGDAIFLGKGFLQANTSILENSAIYGALNVGHGSQFSTLQVAGAVAVNQQAEAKTMNVSGSLSTLSSFFVTSKTTASGETLVQGETQVLQSSILRKLFVNGEAYISSLQVFETLRSQGNASSYSSTFLASTELNIRNNLGIPGDVLAPSTFASFSTGFSTLTDVSIREQLFVSQGMYVRQASLLAADVRDLSTLLVKGNLSTQHISAEGIVYVEGNLFVNRRAAASTLGAPISLNISTLTLSNTLTVDSYGKIPYLKLFDYPEKMGAGQIQDIGSYDVYVGGVLQNRSSILQTDTSNPLKLWTGKDLFVSTFGGLSNISAMTIGSTDVSYPLEETYGIVLVGSNSAITTSNIFYGSNASTIFRATAGSFPNRGFKIRNNGSNLWVAVGTGAAASQSIQYSPDGFNWYNCASGGFTAGGRAVAYGNGLWVAVGYTVSGSKIQYSGNGILWSNATGSPFTSGGDDVAYNGSNGWVAVGANSPASFGILFSGDGISWSNVTGLPVPISFDAVGFGGGRWVASSSLANQVFTSLTGSNNWSVSPTSIVRNAYLYNGTFWLGGGPATGGNPTNSIQLSPNGLVWIPITTGGFTGACYDLALNANQSTFLAVGEDAVPTEQILQYSINGSNWLKNSVFLGSGRGVGVGSIRAPLFQSFFTPNVTSIFRSTLSSGTITASTVRVSSIFGQYSADGSQLTSIGAFASSIRTSSIYTNSTKAIDISAQIFQGVSSFAASKITVNRNTFFSTVNIFVGAGNDSQSNGNVQNSFNLVDWTRSLNNNFEYYGNDVTGTSDPQNALFVSVGADSRTQYTIQWSRDGLTWNPVQTGGFSYATATGIREGKSVAYNSNLGRWVALGVDTGGSNTIYYSDDASNWSLATNRFSDYALKVKASPSGFLAIGNGVKWSADGITWINSGSAPDLTAIGYGDFNPGIPLTGWLGVATSNLYGSDTGGAAWINLGVFTTNSVTDLTYDGSNRWVAVGSNVIQTASNGVSWSNVTTTFGSDITFKTITYNSNINTWAVGARAISSQQSIHYSSNAFLWIPISTGGFSTSIDSYGTGYGLCSLGFSTFATGKSALDIVTATKTAIFQLSTNGAAPNTGINTVSLTTSNSSNVFSTFVRGIAAAPDEFYKLVAVGDGQTPQKTIGRSIDGSPNSWIPAITGGFSTIGYGVTYYQDRWVAIGDAQVSTNYIQYSPDGANWFGTNNSRGIRQGGRGITTGISSLANTFVAVGKDTTTSSIVYSLNGYSWSNAYGSSFNVQGNAVAAGLNWPTLPFGSPPYLPLFVAVGQDTRGETYSISRSEDGIQWSNVNSGGFDIAGYGVAYSIDNKTWVAVGEDSRGYTIQASFTGGYSFTPVTNMFTSKGYGVTYNSSVGVFFAVGENLTGDSEGTIKYSSDGVNWENFSTGYGFVSQKSLGAANGLFTQGFFNNEVVPYIDFTNLIVYERSLPIYYSKQTMRLQSTFTAFNESMFINLSSQVSVGSNQPMASTVLTVYGDIYASSFIYSGELVLRSTSVFSRVIASTVSTNYLCKTGGLVLPGVTVNASNEPRANYMSTIGKSGFSVLDINQTLYATNLAVEGQLPKVGVRMQNPRYELDVQGTFGVSTLSTKTFYAPENIRIAALSNIIFDDQYLKIYEGTNNSLVTTGNRIQTTVSSLTFNSLMTLQVSTQRVGVFTRNPQFDFDVQAHASLSSLRASTINTSLIFLTLQSV